MLDKITEYLEKYLEKPSKKASQNKYIKAIHESLMAIFPIILIGSFFLIIFKYSTVLFKMK